MSRTARVFAVSALALAGLALAGCDGGGGLVGTWRQASADSLDRRYTFFGDGTARIVERPAAGGPMTYEARYEVVGDSVLTLRWTDDVGPDGRFRIALDGDTLRLENPAGGLRTAWVRL